MLWWRWVLSDIVLVVNLTVPLLLFRKPFHTLEKLSSRWVISLFLVVVCSICRNTWRRCLFVKFSFASLSPRLRGEQGRYQRDLNLRSARKNVRQYSCRTAAIRTCNETFTLRHLCCCSVILLCLSDFQAVELAMKFVSDRAYDVARVACARLADIKCYEQVCRFKKSIDVLLLILQCIKSIKGKVSQEFCGKIRKTINIAHLLREDQVS